MLRQTGTIMTKSVLSNRLSITMVGLTSQPYTYHIDEVFSSFSIIIIIAIGWCTNIIPWCPIVIWNNSYMALYMYSNRYKDLLVLRFNGPFNTSKVMLSYQFTKTNFSGQAKSSVVSSHLKSLCNMLLMSTEKYQYYFGPHHAEMCLRAYEDSKGSDQPAYSHSLIRAFPGLICSKLMMSLVNDSLKFTSSDTQTCWNFLLKKCE